MDVRWTPVFIAALAFSPLLAAADGGCNAPAQGSVEARPDLALPDYSVAGEGAEDSAAVASAREWTDYQSAVFASLRTSPDPRDWAIAAMAAPYADDAASKAADLQLLQGAMAAAPDDKLVLWMTVNASRRFASSTVGSIAAAKLQIVEPDNAAVWIEALDSAAKAHDRAAVDAALSRMSSAARMDNHFSDLVRLVAEALERNPPPASLLASIPAESGTRSTFPYTYAAAIGAAFALPGFQYLVNACRTDDSGRNANRSADCGAVGRLMSSHADTLIGRMLGFAVQRVSRTFNDDDVRASRDIDWMVDAYSKATLAAFGKAQNAQPLIDPESEENILAFEKDWINSGSELEAIRLALVRAGIAPSPPADWLDRSSRFSDEAIARDGAYFAEHSLEY